MADSTLKFTEKVLAKIVLDPPDASVDGIPVWVSGNPEVLSVTPSADGMSCSIAGVKGSPDEVPVTCTLDADLGSGVRELVARGSARVLGAEATTVSMTFGPPEPQVPVPSEGRRR